MSDYRRYSRQFDAQSADVTGFQEPPCGELIALSPATVLQRTGTANARACPLPSDESVDGWRTLRWYRRHWRCPSAETEKAGRRKKEPHRWRWSYRAIPKSNCSAFV